MKNTVLAKLFKTLIRGYQNLISPLIPARCRYYPTCSNYGLQALEWYGARRGGWLAVKRICRCHPLGGHGVDFVPLPLYQFQFAYYGEIGCEGLNNQKKTVGKFVYKNKTDYNQQLNLWLSSKSKNKNEAESY